jgi:hypothetical protein
VSKIHTTIQLVTHTLDLRNLNFDILTLDPFVGIWFEQFCHLMAEN